MANQVAITQEQKNVLLNEGAFHGVAALVASNRMNSADASAVLATAYEGLLNQIREAKSELNHIERALSRLEHTCNHGKHSKHVSVGDSNHVHLNQNMIAFDGWVVSLMETDLTMTGILNPKFTRTKITEFGNAMNALMDKRMSEQFLRYKDSGLFKGYLNNY